MNELILSLYFLIGFLIGIWRISQVTDAEDSSMACIAGIFIVILWPIYIIYKIIKYNIYKKLNK